MGADPFRLFADDPGKQAALKIVWPELHDALARVGQPDEVVRACVLGDCAPDMAAALGVPRRRAVGRVTRNGHPACRHHIHLADRPGGWPLKIITSPSRAEGIVWKDEE